MLVVIFEVMRGRNVYIPPQAKTILIYHCMDVLSSSMRIRLKILLYIHQWAMRKLGVDKWLVQEKMALYISSRGVVKVYGEKSEEFEVSIGFNRVLL